MRATRIAAVLFAGCLAGLPALAEPDEKSVHVPIDPAGVDERCKWETLPGSWKSVRTGNIWTFAPDGTLSCDGSCSFVKATGAPVSWAYEPGAALFARPISHVRLEFERAVFQGVFGSFRCRIQNDGMTLVLEPDEDEPMVFHRSRLR